LKVHTLAMFKKTLSVFLGVAAFVDKAVVAGLARTYLPAQYAALVLTVAFLALHIEPDQPVGLQATTSAVGVIGTLPTPARLVLLGAADPVASQQARPPHTVQPWRMLATA
jgi:hypothetical protein